MTPPSTSTVPPTPPAAVPPAPPAAPPLAPPAAPPLAPPAAPPLAPPAAPPLAWPAAPPAAPPVLVPPAPPPPVVGVVLLEQPKVAMARVRNGTASFLIISISLGTFNYWQCRRTGGCKFEQTLSHAVGFVYLLFAVDYLASTAPRK